MLFASVSKRGILNFLLKVNMHGILGTMTACLFVRFLVDDIATTIFGILEFFRILEFFSVQRIMLDFKFPGLL